MRYVYSIFALLILPACASIPGSTEALIESPSSTVAMQTAMQLDDAYRKTLNQMKACYDRGGAFGVKKSIHGDKSDKDALISYTISGMFSHYTLLSAKFDKDGDLTKITIYSASDQGQGRIPSQIDYWLNKNGVGCEPQ